MQTIRNLLAEYGNPLEWDSATKAALLLGVCVAMHTQYITWAYFQVSPFAAENTGYYVNIPFIESQLNQYSGLLFISLVLFLGVFFLRKRYPDKEFFEHLSAQYYGLTLSYCSYLIGNLSIATGVVIAGAPVVGFILFHRRPVFLAFFVSLTAQAYIAYASMQGYVEYAPIINNLSEPDGTISYYWLANIYLFTTPHLLILTAAAYYMLNRWRTREEEVIMLSLTDPLTHLSNRRCILSTLTKEIARSCRHDPPLSIILVDLDHFKNVNDTLGHPVGDQVLVAAAASLKSSVRQSDHVGRYGGEEFLIILPETNTQAAIQLGERCRKSLEALKIDTGKREPLQITASFGLFCNETDRCDSSESMLHFADEALYSAKKQGRNKVVVYGTKE